MKAKSFLEWCYDNYPIESNMPNLALADFASRTGKIINFYSQPFRPEMITEYFEGWEKPEISLNYYYDLGNDMEYMFAEYGKTYKLWCIAETETVKFQGLFPQTLDQFITDCQRANIELNWKQEIINKNFK